MLVTEPLRGWEPLRGQVQPDLCVLCHRLWVAGFALGRRGTDRADLVSPATLMRDGNGAPRVESQEERDRFSLPQPRSQLDVGAHVLPRWAP